ncbi:MAG TPA: aminotransferase class I/II-fold pyridoxal phosphate-dependent enzyme [Patescibacteria group bacterium]|nr:aminotransferase class I/II-fold pyridoxal phosphate-dependent enzyme [Patescibacteria group bacterium]
MQSKKVLVTRTFLPPFEEYEKILKRAWESRWITNHGVLAQELENNIKKLLKVKHAFFVTNGTVAIQLAIRALDLRGEIITTPFTFAATTTSIVWENCKPVFVDIKEDDLTIDEEKIEAAITPETTAILAVHVFGYPCNVEKIEKIAKKHNLKVIYDAAHAFGVKINGRSIFKYGDVSTLSLHATKLFHTVEGGFVITDNDKVAKKVRRMRDFGLSREGFPTELGINAKNSEMHAAMGLANLKYVPAIREVRNRAYDEYKRLLKDSGLHEIKYLNSVIYNYSYFPVVFKSEEELLLVKKALEAENIFPRRYFYPSLNTMPYVEYVACPVSESVAKRILCLPMFHDINMETIRKIVNVILDTIKSNTVSVSVGIPAYNEEGNLSKLIASIKKQKNSNFRLERIYINIDGSSDKTLSVAKKLAKSDKRIKVMGGIVRRGKPHRLNEIYKINKSDLLATFDADVYLRDEETLGKMVEVFLKDKKAQVAAGNFIPAKAKSVMGRIIYANNLLWNNTREDINGGDHIANLYGGASMLRKKFSKSFIYPSDITCDEEYLYVKAKEKNGFRFLKNVSILFKTPENVREVVLQGKRFLNERDVLVEYFGEDVEKLHDISMVYKLRGLFKTLFKNPVYVPLAVALNLILKITPYTDSLNSYGMWEIATSTKVIVEI